MMGRIAGVEYATTFHDGCVCYVGRNFAIEFTEEDPVSTVRGDAKGRVDLTAFHLMNALRKAVLAVPGGNFVNCLP